MRKLEIENFPAFLINNKINYIEKIKDASKMQMAPLLTIKSNSLINCYILDGNDKLYKIIEIMLVGEMPKKKWFDFTFGNPTKKIEVLIENVTDSDLIQKCIKLKDFVKDIDAYSIEHEN